MKKLFILLIMLGLVIGGCVAGPGVKEDDRLDDWVRAEESTKKWSSYTDFGSGSIAVGDTFLIRDIDDDTTDDGYQFEYTWADLLTDLTTNLTGNQEAFGAGWDADTGIPQKADLENYFLLFDTDRDGLVESAGIDTVVTSVMWVGGGMIPDGTQCADASSVQINSGPYQYTIICADNDASTLYGSIQMPDSWDAGNLVFELAYVQTAADTSALNGDITIQCRGAGETVNNTWESEVAMDDTNVTGSNAVDHLTSGNVSGTCVAGDTVYWRWQMDAAGTTTAVATLHFVSMKMEYTSNVGD